MDIIGIGTDIVEIKRMKPFLKNKKLRNKIFTEEEFLYANKYKDPLPSLAVKFAAKESILKIFKSGSILLAKYIEINQDIFGAPQIILYDPLRLLMRKKSINYWHISLSHEKEFAIAFVIGGKK